VVDAVLDRLKNPQYMTKCKADIIGVGVGGEKKPPAREPMSGARATAAA
jgi:hypothetical protein